jgi:hypothetical protein
MSERKQWYASVDWGSQSHCVFRMDETGRKTGEKIFKHGGEGLAEMAAWLMTTSGAAEPGQVLAANCRPDRNISGAGVFIISRVAPIGPIPATLARRRPNHRPCARP